MANPPPSGPSAPGTAAASKIFLVVALLLGILATVLAFFFINNAGASNTGTPVWAVVASHDIAPNTPLDPERDLKRVRIPPQFAAFAIKCIDWEGRASYKGWRMNREILADQPVFVGDIAPVGVNLVLEDPSLRALTIPAEPGMTIPGDYIKIMVTKSNLINVATTGPAIPGAMPYDATIIGKEPGFKVLAVGGYLYMTRPMVIGADRYGASSSSNKTVTLQVTEAQAKEIMSALGSAGSSNKATLLICPSANTAPPTATPSEPTTTPATKP